MIPRPFPSVKPVILIGFGILFISCFDLGKKNLDVVRAEAYVPIYGYDSARHKVSILSAQPLLNAGKIYVWGNLLFQVDQNKGIHVVNYSDRNNPQKISFIQVYGCTEVAVKGTSLFANNIRDLVAIDISDPTQAREISRIKNAFPQAYDHNYNFQPSEKGKYFVCPLPEKGDVIGWSIEKNIKGANCFSY